MKIKQSDMALSSATYAHISTRKTQMFYLFHIEMD
jgi:hypothetical protein